MDSTPTAIQVMGDCQIGSLIRRAQGRLVVVAPAVTSEVAEAICDRWRTLPRGSVSVVLDIDPEVYRLGYGEQAALESLVRTAADIGEVVRRQPGVRIGVVIADSQTLVYSPTPQLIEAGPNTRGGANAILLGAPSPGLENDLIPASGDPRVGPTPMSTGELQAIQHDLTENPPQKFDISRRMNVFNAYFEFVELELSGVHIDRKRIQIPTHLLGVADPKTRDQLSSHFQVVSASVDTQNRPLVDT